MKEIPRKGGVYLLYNGKKLKYVGKAKNLRERLRIHKKIVKGKIPNTTTVAQKQLWKSEATNYKIIITNEREKIEKFLIKNLKPDLNIEHNPNPNHEKIERNRKLYKANIHGFESYEEYDKKIKESMINKFAKSAEK
jgi:excinuclease UvrABC nuclease subunit